MRKGTISQQEIEQGQWNAVLTAITRDYRGAHAKLEVFGPEVNYQVETENRPFDGIAADTKDGERTVWVHLGELRHGVQDVTAIRVVPRVGAAGTVIEVEAKDGTKTLLTLSAPGEYELPAGEPG